MKTKLKRNWLAVGTIWGVIALLTAWNMHMIDQVQSRRQALERLQMDMRFLRANLPDIQNVRTRKARLAHAVPSFSLGYVVVENDLKRLSWDVGLRHLRVEADHQAAAMGSVPISIAAKGDVPATVAWIVAVEEAYPHLAMETMSLGYDHQERQCTLQAVFTYRYTLHELDGMG